jgi:hypothetical protein
MNLQILLFTFILLITTTGVSGQGAHHTYPFSLGCPDGVVSAGETISLKAEFEGGQTGDRYSPTYNWSVTSGRIMSGQGTPAISLEIPREEASTLVVTLNRTFLEAHFPGVQREANCAIPIAPLPSARMTDEFRTRGGNCEEGFARLDNFLVELNNNPNDRAIIVLYGDAKDAKAAARREIQLRNHLRFRRFDPDRITFVRGASKTDGTTQFWLIPPGAEDPVIEPASMVIEKPSVEPYLYSANYLDGVPGCSGYIYDVAEYAKELTSLPGSRGRVVIGQPSRARYSRELKEIMSTLSANGVPRSRITAVYKYVRPNRMLEVTELWVIPARQRE